MDAPWVELFGPVSGKVRGYHQIVDILGRAIADGVIRVGDRLPTQRDVSAGLGVAIGTVTRAYSEAEHQGLIVGRVGVGTFVSGPAARSANVQQADGHDAVVDLTTSRPPLEGAATHFANALRILSKRHDVGKLLGTEPPNGWMRHRIAASKWLSRRLAGVEPNQIVMCNGVQHALSSIFAGLAQAGDIVVTEEINYPGVKLLGDLHRIRLLGVSMDDEGIRADEVAEACKRQAVRFLLCSPTIHNPTTISMSTRRRETLTELAIRYNFTIIENDILGMMAVEGLPSMYQLIPRRTIYVTGLSKVVAAGLRVGFIVASPSLLQPLMSGVRSTMWMPQPLMLEIFAHWVDNGSIDKVIAWHREEISARLVMVRQFIDSAELRVNAGSYHVWLPLPNQRRSADFVDEAYGQRVALSPSDTFAIDEVAPNGLRIGIGAPNSRERLSAGLAVIAELLANHPRDERLRRSGARSI